MYLPRLFFAHISIFYVLKLRVFVDIVFAELIFSEWLLYLSPTASAWRGRGVRVSKFAFIAGYSSKGC